MSVMKSYKQKFDTFKEVLDKENPVIVEIGAHFGEDSMRFCEVFPESKVFCFEPDPRCIEVFKKYVKDDRIKLFELALSNKNGKADFYQSYDGRDEFVPEKYDWINIEDYRNNKLSNSGSSSLKKGYRNNLAKIVVETKRFDDWYTENNIGEIDLAWIDVQGAEKDVLEGMGNSIENIAIIWIEYGEKEYDGALTRNDTISYMEKKGFLVVDSLSSIAESGDLMLYNSKRYSI